VLGADAFYFKKRDWGRDKMISVGRTELGDYVEIGANCTVDRGVTDVTYIGHHTKLDNLVQVGHDVRIGQRCVIAAQVGIAGTSRVEDDVILWGQVGVATGLVVEKGAVVQAQSGLIHNVPSGKIYFGSPASEARAAWKRLAILEMMADRWQEIQALLDERTPGE
jgi:UDP-3-O-[3-hydroxymyristoyl] glucosamine N-acyltransferase